MTDDRVAVGVPQSALDLFEQIEDGLGLPGIKRRHGERDDAKGGRR